MAEAKKKKPSGGDVQDFQKRAIEGIRKFDDSNSGGLYAKFLKYMADSFPGAFEDKSKPKKGK